MKKASLLAILSDFALYALQFLIIPQICGNVIGRGNAGIAAIALTTVLISVVGALAFSDKVTPWLIGFAVYAALALIYTPQGAYGIGIEGIDLDEMQSHYDASARLSGIAVLAVVVLILQLGSLGLAKLIKMLLRPRKR